MLISVAFYHGLGDSTYFAHQIPLYLQRGHDVAIECAPDKSLLFRAAGARLIENAQQVHPWDHPHMEGGPQFPNHWEGNKSAFNISRAPLPDIGEPATLWREYLDVELDLSRYASSESKQRVAQYVRELPRPLILLHTMGNSSAESKNLTEQETFDLYVALIDHTDACILLLDWDDRVPRMANGRIRHLSDDWRPLSTDELYWLICRADLLIGIDSGPLHFSRFTDIPAIGLWKDHFCSHFALPRRETLNLQTAQSRFADWIACRRVPYNVLVFPESKIDAQVVAAWAVTMMGQRKYLEAPGKDCLLQGLIAGGRRFDSPLAEFVDRHKSFAAVFDYLQSVSSPVIVETGCIRGREDWSAGFATYLFGLFVAEHGGRIISIDKDVRSIDLAAEYTEEFEGAVQLHHGDSREWLGSYRGPPIDLLYLDSADVGTPGYAECCLEEAQAAAGKLAPHAGVLVDDTCWRSGAFLGKGSLAVPWLIEEGFGIRYAGYQVFLRR